MPDGARSIAQRPARQRRVLVLSLSDLAMDARVLRQVDFLAREYQVVVAALSSPPDLAHVAFVELVRDVPRSVRQSAESALRAGLRIAGSYHRAYELDARVRRWREQLAGLMPVDAIVVNDLFTLPLARSLDASVPLIFDAHEHWTSESASWTRAQRLSMRGAHEWLVDRYVPETAAMMTVSPGIAQDYAERAGVQPALVTNAPYFQRLSPSEVTEPIRLFHAGVADERRRLEGMIEAVGLLGDRFVLDLVLARDNDYRRRLERLAGAVGRARVLPPVPPGELVQFANGYDVGVYLFPATFPNQVHSLPNKLFDFIQARLAVAIGPSPAMAGIVREWDCGVVSSSFSPGAFAEALNALTPENLAEMKRNADRAARVLTAEENRETVLSLVRRALAEAAPAPA